MEQRTLSTNGAERPSSFTDRIFMYMHNKSMGDRLLLRIAILGLFGFLVWGLVAFNDEQAVETSTRGGTFTEGIVGTPRFINPVLAVTRADKDLSALVYSGLMKLGPDGALVPDIAANVTISDDGTIYNVTLRDDVVFHDGTPLTAEDVAFTMSRIQDPALGSPLRASFDGVEVETVGEHELNFILPEPYSPFIENLTVGVLPAHIWQDASVEEFPFSQHNSEPIGAGPYKTQRITRDTSGIPRSYILEPHEQYHAERPKIETVSLYFYPNEEALLAAFSNGEIESVAGIDADALERITINEETHEVVTTPLPRTFAVFFNQNKSAALRYGSARRALNAAVDREALIDEVLGGYGNPLYSPIPPGFGINASTTDIGSTTPLDAARTILRETGWEINDETGVWEVEIDEVVTALELDIATANNPVFEATAEHLRQTWEQLGASVTVRQFEQSDLTQSIIRPREYQALLFGTIVGRSLDFYSFWHSSQRNDPGLNVALYANITTDSILAEARRSASTTERAAALKQFEGEILAETPAVFLYSPEFMYVFPKRITGASFRGLAEPHERFSTISEWHIETESVWPVFNTHN